VLRLKDLRGRVVGEKVTAMDGKSLREFEHRFHVGGLEGSKVGKSGTKWWPGAVGRRAGKGRVRRTRERIAWEWRGAKCFAGNGEN
jgi:hypothetical protein